MNAYRFFFGMLLVCLCLFSLCAGNKGSSSNNAKGVLCGGWDKYGDVVCDCDGKLEKPACPVNASCDSGAYICHGICGFCKCYQGPSNLGREITCGGRNLYSGRRASTD